MRKAIFRLSCALALLAGVMVAPGSAQTMDEETFFTFKAPVALPGVTLTPGRYEFRVPDIGGSSSQIVEVLSAGRTERPVGMFLTVPANRAEPAPDAEVQLAEVPKGRPAAIDTWWYPGLTTGYAFLYPQDFNHSTVRVNAHSTEGEGIGAE